MTTQILVTKPGAIHIGDRATLRSEGIIVVETDTPSDVKVLAPGGSEIGAGGLLYAAMRALNAEYNYKNMTAFASEVLAEMERERAAAKALPRDDHGRFAKRTGA